MLAPAPALCQSARPVGCDPRAADGYHCRSEEEPRGPGGCPGTRREVLSSRRIGVVGCRPAGEGGPCPMAARTGDTRVPWNRGEASDHGEPGHRRGTRLLRTRPSGHSRGARLTTGWAAHADELETSIHLFLRPAGVHRDLVQAGNDMVPFDFRWQDVEPGGMVGLTEWWSTFSHTGVLGGPILAAAEKEEVLCTATAEALASLVREFKERPMHSREDHH